MEEGVHQIFNTNYYTYQWGNILIAPVFALFILSLIATIIRISNKERPFVRWYFYVSLFLVPFSFVGVYWDVYQTGRQATAICREKGGIHVYKTAEVEGFLGAGDIERYSKYGFSYLEAQGAFKKYRYTMKDGKKTRTEVDEFVSDYEVKSLKYDEKLTKRISLNKYYVANRHTGEILAEDIRIYIYPGWADSLFFGLTGFSSNPWICSDRGRNKLYSDTIDLHTLKPTK